jgi:iron complex outermembrane receptor protein
MPEAERNSTVGLLIGAATLMTVSAGAVATTDFATLGVQTTDDTAVGGNAVEPELADVVVTARRRTELAQDVPIPIATIGGGDLSGFNQTRLEDLDEHLPRPNDTPTREDRGPERD